MNRYFIRYADDQSLVDYGEDQNGFTSVKVAAGNLHGEGREVDILVIDGETGEFYVYGQATEDAAWDSLGRFVFGEDGNPVITLATCGGCGRSWNDAMITSVTPTPSARCPYEYDHDDEDA